MDIISSPESVTLVGRLTPSSVATVRQALHDAVERTGGHVTVNAAQLVVRDAQGLGVLVGAQRLAERRGGALVLADPNLSLRHLLARTGMHKVLRVVQSDHHVAADASPAVPQQREAQPSEAAADAAPVFA